MLNFRQIEVFRAIMITRTVNGAAKLLNVSQPGISRILKYTEDKIGMKLFERKKGRLFPTPEGREIFEEIQVIYKQIQNLEWTIERLVQGEDNILKIGSSPSVGRYLVPKVLALFKKDFPKVTVMLDILSIGEVADYVSLQKGDYMVTIFPVDHPAVDCQAFMDGGLVCVVPKGHPLAEKDSLRAEDIAKHRLIAFEEDTPHGKIIRGYFKDAKVDYNVATFIRFAETACALVEQGMGVALVDEFTVMGNRYPDLTIIPVEAGHKFSLRLNFHANAPRSNIALQFERYFNRVISGLPDTK